MRNLKLQETQQIGGASSTAYETALYGIGAGSLIGGAVGAYSVLTCPTFLGGSAYHFLPTGVGCGVSLGGAIGLAVVGSYMAYNYTFNG